jgi:hypothetical protein
MSTENGTNAGRRPVEYTPEIGSTICDRLDANETLREICADPAMPDKGTVLRWLAQHAEFRGEYAFTRQLQAQELVAEACDIADDPRTGCLERVRGGKVVSVSGRHELAVYLFRLKIRWWVADRLCPKTAPRSQS